MRLARAPGAELDVVLVLNAGDRATLTPADPGYDRLLLETAEAWLAEALTLVPAGISVHTHLEHADSLTQGLPAAAARLQANLIVVGAATHGLLGRFAIGSVANGLLHSAHVPVALAPEGSRVMGTDEPIGRVTCAVGTKPGADGLLAAGIRLARTVDAPLRLVSLVAIDRPGADAQTIQLATDHAKVSPRFFNPGYATIASAVVAAGFYTIMRFVSEDVLWDTITTLGMMICFYYSLTAFACVWYFRRQWFVTVRNAFFTFVFPLIGGIILAVLLCTTLVDSMDLNYGSGSEIFGLGLVFVLGMAILLIGVVIMIVQAWVRPAFFRGETLSLAAPRCGEHEE